MSDKTSEVTISHYVTFRIEIPYHMGTEEGEAARQKITDSILSRLAELSRGLPIKAEMKVEQSSNYIPVFWG